MIWKIAKKEFLLNLMTFKFAVGAVACVLLTVVFMPILTADYRQRLELYNQNVSDNEAELRNVIVYRNIKHPIYRPPAVLSAFSAGLEKQLAGSAKIELEKVPELSVTERGGNPYLPILAVFDESLIFKIIISILALLVAYDVVSGEREQGTLKLMLADPVARHQVLLGKLFAGTVCFLSFRKLTVPFASHNQGQALFEETSSSKRASPGGSLVLPYGGLERLGLAPDRTDVRCITGVYCRDVSVRAAFLVPGKTFGHLDGARIVYLDHLCHRHSQCKRSIGNKVEAVGIPGETKWPDGIPQGRSKQ